MFTKREIFTQSAAEQLGPLLQSIMSTELIFPSKQLWIYSPWISNIPLLDNRGYTFRHVEPLWSRDLIYLTSILEKLLEKGTEVMIMSNDTEHNHDFFWWIESMNVKGYNNLKGKKSKDLHQKGLLGDRFCIKGSMNFTYRGLYKLEERVEFTCEREEVAKAKIEFDNHWKSINVL